MNLEIPAKPSLTLRIGIGKFLGLVVGLLGFVSLIALFPETSWSFRWGVLLWYTTIGALVGVYGVYTEHPILEIPLPWWFRATIIGAWMNFVLLLFLHEQFKGMMMSFTGLTSGWLTSPGWFVVEGALVGLFIGWFATKYGGEGPATVGR